MRFSTLIYCTFNNRHHANMKHSGTVLFIRCYNPIYWAESPKEKDNWSRSESIQLINNAHKQPISLRPSICRLRMKNIVKCVEITQRGILRQWSSFHSRSDCTFVLIPMRYSRHALVIPPSGIFMREFFFLLRLSAKSYSTFPRSSCFGPLFTSAAYHYPPK